MYGNLQVSKHKISICEPYDHDGKSRPRPRVLIDESVSEESVVVLCIKSKVEVEDAGRVS